VRFTARRFSSERVIGIVGVLVGGKAVAAARIDEQGG
jgi:hypothetical protein